jgi:hypothetical protein
MQVKTVNRSARDRVWKDIVHMAKASQFAVRWEDEKQGGLSCRV